MKTVQILSTLTILVLVSSCGTGTRFPTSDVPFLEPTTWSDSGIELLLRFEEGNPDKLLFFHRSVEQREMDILDTSTSFKHHDPIYRFDRITNVFDIVDDSVWENNNSEITDCLRFTSRDSSFTTARTEEPGTASDLIYADEKVAVEGGAFLRFFPATFSDSLHTQAVGVLSTDGFSGLSLFLFGFAPTGQHFHQLFSEVDGQPLGPPLRIGVGGTSNSGIQICWALDNKFVIYAEFASSNGGYSKICVVDVEDEIQSVSGN